MQFNGRSNVCARQKFFPESLMRYLCIWTGASLGALERVPAGEFVFSRPRINCARFRRLRTCT